MSSSRAGPAEPAATAGAADADARDPAGLPPRGAVGDVAARGAEAVAVLGHLGFDLVGGDEFGDHVEAADLQFLVDEEAHDRFRGEIVVTLARVTYQECGELSRERLRERAELRVVAGESSTV